MYKPKSKKPKKFDYDLIVIGSGAGGGVAAHIAAKKRKKVAMIEREKYGGECPNYGCVPTKSLLQSAETLQIIDRAPKFGITAKEVSFSFTAVNAWRSSAVANTGVSEGKSVYENEGITTLDGSAHFLSPWEIAVNDNTYTARNFLIASGTKNIVPPIPGLVETGYITYREAISLPKPPKSLFIVGGGAIGCEFAEIYSSFGTKVCIAEFGPRLITKEDPEAGDLLGALFKQKGIHVFTNAKVMKVTKHGEKKIVSFEMNDKNHSVSVDEILVTAGKVPNIDLGLENAGVKYNAQGVTTNLRMQTSTEHIYAAGDVTGKYMYTHTAAYQSRIAVHNMYTSKKVQADYHAVPRCIFVLPEIAAVGMTEAQIKERKKPYQIGAVPISVIGRSNTSNHRSGFVKVIANKSGILLGATIVAPRAGEMIQELALAIQHRMMADAITETIHAFPTWSEAVRVACSKIKCS